jgi:hypothetical protein
MFSSREIQPITDMFEARLIDEILSAWVAVASARNQQKLGASDVPDPRDLRKLLEVAFLASTKHEEGRPLQFRIVFTRGSSAESLCQHWPWVDDLPFAERLPFSVASLRKLALAFDQDSSALVITRDGPEYFVVGAIFYGRHISRLEVGGSRGRPPVLTLSTRTSGSVIVGYGDSVVGRFYDGEFLLAKANWAGSGELVNHVLREIARHPGYARHKGEYWYLYRDLLERLYSSAAKFGHGGIIAWVPSNLLGSALQYVTKGIAISARWSGSYMASVVLDRHQKEEDGSILAENKRRLADYVDMLSRLSCVDGAVIVDDKLSPHRFAVHLNAGEWNGDVFEGPLRNELPSAPFDISGLATRHNSAIRFAGANPGTIIFVISEDGPVRIISRLKDAVLIWPEGLNTVFMDQ